MNENYKLVPLSNKYLKRQVLYTAHLDVTLKLVNSMEFSLGIFSYEPVMIGTVGKISAFQPQRP